MKLTSWLFKAARLSADLDALASGDPKRMGRRGKNKLVGRSLGRVGLWCWLWK
jgi:hypothetical protein